MEGGTFSRLGNGAQLDSKVLQALQKSFVQLQNILDQNRLLIDEINQNHKSRIPDNLGRNVGLIRELNNSIRRVVDLYADLSYNLTRFMEASSEGDSSGALKSDGKATQKRNRPGPSWDSQDEEHWPPDSGYHGLTVVKQPSPWQAPFWSRMKPGFVHSIY